jgi:hypothetical protein
LKPLLKKSAHGLQAGTTAGKSFAQKMGATVHGQGELPVNLLYEVAFTFLF